MSKVGYLFVSNSTKPSAEVLESTEPIRPGSFSKSAIWAANEMGWELHMGTNRNHPEKIKSLDYDMKFYDQHSYRSIFAIRDNITAYRNLSRYVKNNPQIEIIHCNTPIGGVVGRLVGHKYNKKVIYTVHGFHFFKGAPLFNRTILKWVEIFLARYTDILITINHEDYEAACKLKLKNGGKVFYISGVGMNLSAFENPPEDLRELKRKELGLTDNDIVMISMGDLVPRKNYSLAIKAMAKVKVHDLKYLICGVGPEKEMLMQLAESLGLKNSIYFLGFRRDVRDLLYSSDIFVFPTLQEGLPRSMMEAMATGLPGVVSDIRGNNDLMTDGQGGFLVKTSDVDGFGDAIRKIAIDHDLAKKMGQENKRRVQEFSLPVVQQQLLKIFSEL